MKTILTMFLFAAFVYTNTFAAMAIAGLPANGRCTAESFGRGDGDANTIPGSGRQLKISNLAVTKNSATVGLSFTGITAEIEDDVVNVANRRGFYHIWRCDEGSTAATKWETLTATDGSFKRVISNAAGQGTLSFTDTFGGQTPNSQYYYLAVAAFFKNETPTTTDAVAYGCAFNGCQDGFNTIIGFNQVNDTIEVNPTWSRAISAVADFRGSGFAYSPAAATTIDATVDVAVNQAFTVTSTAGVVTNPAYSFALTGTLPAGVTAATNGSTYTVSGTPTAVGVTDLTLVSTLTATGFSETVSAPFSIVVKPVGISIATATNLGQQEKNTTQTYTLTSANGLSAANSTISTPVFTLGTHNVTNGTVSIAGNVLTITLLEEANVGSTFNVPITVTDTAKTGQTADARLITTATSTFTVTVKDHEFSFAQTNLTDASAYATGTTVARYTELQQLTNTANASTVYTINTVNNTTPGNITITGGSLDDVAFTALEADARLTANGLVFAAANGSATLAVNDLNTFKAALGKRIVLTINALSSNQPLTVTTTFGFIITDRVAPTVVSATWAPFTWGVAGKDAYLPILNSVHTLNVVYSKSMSIAPNVKVIVGGAEFTAVKGSITANTNVAYTYNFTPHAALVAPTTAANSINVTCRVETDGKDAQPAGLETKVNSNTGFDVTAVKIVNPLVVVSNNGTTGFKAGNTLTATLNKLVSNTTVVNDATAFVSSIGSSFTARLTGATTSTVELSPLTRWDYATSDVALVGSKFLDAEGLPLLNGNVAGNKVIAVTIEADTYAPVVKDVSVDSSSTGTAVTYVVTFDETITGASAVVKNGATTLAAPTVSQNANKVTVVVTGLPFNSKIDVAITANDAGNNSVTVPVQVVTLATEDVASLVVEGTDTTKPFVSSVTPDLRDPNVASAVSAKPLITVDFNEVLDTSVVPTIVLTDGVSASIAGTVKDTFTKGFQFTSASQLKAGTKYKLTISGVKDSSNNVMVDYVAWFTTLGATAVAAAPTFKGSGFAGRKLSTDQALVFYFSETLDLNTLLAGFTLQGTAPVTGSWTVKGNTHVFTPATKLSAATSYTYTFSTAVKGLLGNALGAAVTGTVMTKAAQAIEGFTVVVKPLAESSVYQAKVQFSPLADESSIASYEFRALNSNTLTFGDKPSAAMHTVVTGVAGAKRTTSFNVANLTANQNVKFWVEAVSSAGSKIGTAVASVYGVVSSPLKIKEVFISSNQTKISTVALGTAGAEDATLIVDPSVLKTSAALTVSQIDGNTKAAMDSAIGGGGKVIQPVQFGPDGMEFNSPLEFALRFSYAGFANAATLTEKNIFDLVDVLTFSADSGKWVTDGVVKTRVVTSAGNIAQVFAQTSHFSVFTVGEALSFTTTATTLVKDTAGVYSVSWNAGLDAANVSVVLKNDAGTDVTANYPGFVTKSATKITLGGTAVQENLNVTVTLTGDTSSPAPKTFVIPMEITIANSARPPLVAGLNITQTIAATQATVSWTAITGTTTTIRDIYIEYSQDSTLTTGVVVVAAKISPATTVVTGLTAGKTYFWRVRSRNVEVAQPDARLSSEYFKDVTFGSLTSTVDTATVKLGAGVSFAAITTGTLVSSSIIRTNGTIGGPNGETPIVAGGLFEFDFPTSTTHKSVAFTVNDTSSNLDLYHYSATKNGWETVSNGGTTNNMYYLKTTGTGALDANCGFVVAANQTCIKLFSKGEGSPFAAVNVPAAPVVVRSGGGGGCSLTAGDDGLAGWLNFLLIFLPLGLLYLKRK
ncbi:MAG: Ig-like domain-containing protein [Candidatus Cloacimonetes bacterium]|nr:Ig-like domain-containing protein [Candidatus Cloacimonadota bacterium]